MTAGILTGVLALGTAGCAAAKATGSDFDFKPFLEQRASVSEDGMMNAESKGHKVDGEDRHNKPPHEGEGLSENGMREPPDMAHRKPVSGNRPDMPPDEEINHESETDRTVDHYYEYMLSNGAKDDNMVFSPESMNTSLTIYSHLINDEAAEALRTFTGDRDFLARETNNAFKKVDRIWVNKDKGFNIEKAEEVKNLAYKMDMSDPKAATEKKDSYVAENTDGFIESTPTELNSDTICDVMDIVYFKDTWRDGDKEMVPESIRFTNADGSTTDVQMFVDGGSHGRKTDYAHEYGMPYKNGLFFHVILPDEGHGIDEIKISDFMGNGKSEPVRKIILNMPEFDTKTTLQTTFSDLGLSEGTFRKEIYDGADAKPGEVTQVARIKVDHEGTEAAAVSEIMVSNGAVRGGEPEEIYEMICDRPFVYYIDDGFGENVMFIGTVNKM